MPRITLIRIHSAAWVTLVLLAASLASATSALALPPHVDSGNGESCAMCHRAHTSGSDVGWANPSTNASGSALLVGQATDGVDVGLCYACHGIEALGSSIDVETSFTATSTHSLATTDVPYGPAPMQCSSCHDAHGAARDASGTPLPHLLRAYDASGTVATSGEEVCAACHPNRAADRWDGLAVFKQTAHFLRMEPPAGSAGIRCLACHESHGSAIAPLIVSQVAAPAASGTATVTGDDRSLCLACHSEAFASWEGSSTYATSSHAQSAKTTTSPGEWSGAATPRRVGECQTCHAAMGREAANGSAVAKLLEIIGPGLCLACHDKDGPATPDIASLGFPASASGDLELVVGWSPDATSATDGRIDVYAKERTGFANRPLVGPREYTLPSGTGSKAPLGAIAAGDVDGDGVAEIVAADRFAPRLTVFRANEFRGISAHADGSGTSAIDAPAPADIVVVADLVPGGAKEIATINRLDASLRVYSYSATTATFTRIGSVVPLAADPGAAAAGNVRGLGTELVVTSRFDSTYSPVYWNGTNDWVVGAAVNTGADPVGIAVADLVPGSPDEVVTVHAGESTRTASVFSGGALVADGDAGGPAGAHPTAVAVSDVIASLSGPEVHVALSNPAAGGASAVDTMEWTGSGFGSVTTLDTGVDARTSALAAGDVDADGKNELIAAAPGVWAGRLPRLLVLEDNGTGQLTTELTLLAGGSELGGGVPSLLVTDLGAFGPSRHPTEAASGTHVSTETAGLFTPLARHVECVDCHDPHQATNAKVTGPLQLPGTLRGVAGVSVSNVGTDSVIPADEPDAVFEYEVCLRCHSESSRLQGGRDIAYEVNPANPSQHAIEVSSMRTNDVPSASYTPGWGNLSILYCADCHDNADAAVMANGPHVSPDAPILRAPYAGVDPRSVGMLCYNCHQRDVYGVVVAPTSAEATASLFYDVNGATVTPLHSSHVGQRGIACQACHVSHGSQTVEHLLRSDLGYEHTAGADGGGTCTLSCHGDSGGSKPYLRTP